MGRIVECQLCKWRGWMAFYERHLKVSHPEVHFAMPNMVDFAQSDSRPIVKVESRL